MCQNTLSDFWQMGPQYGSKYIVLWVNSMFCGISVFWFPVFFMAGIVWTRYVMIGNSSKTYKTRKWAAEYNMNTLSI